MTIRPCVTHHHACDCREAAHAALMRRAADAIESHNLYASGDEPFLRCNICQTEADDELGPQHTADCFVAQLRAASGS